MPTSLLTILLLAVLLLATLGQPAAAQTTEHIYLPIIAASLPMSSTASPVATPTAVVPPPVNQ